MGISATEFFNNSSNGKAMLVMLAQKDHTELVRSVCEWLVDTYQKDLVAAAVDKGASPKQAQHAAEGGVSGLRAMAEGLNDRNVVSAVTSIVDGCFQRHYNAGKPQYDKAMAWFADELRKRVKD